MQPIQIGKFQSVIIVFDGLILSTEKTIHHLSFILSCLFSRTQNLVDIIFF